MKRSIWIALMAAWFAGAVVASEVRYADEFNLAGSVCGLGKRTLPRQSVDGHPLTVGGKVFVRGFGSHSEGAVGFRMDGRVEAFDALVGVDDDAMAATSAIISVRASMTSPPATGCTISISRTDTVGTCRRSEGRSRHGQT